MLTIIYMVAIGVICFIVGMIVEMMIEIPQIRRIEEELERFRNNSTQYIEIKDERIPKKNYFEPF